MWNQCERQLDALSIFNSVPGNYLILSPDVPHFTIRGATDAYLKATYTKREDIIGKGLFEVFPDNPQSPDAAGVRNLSSSLQYVITHKKEHRMENQRYDVVNSSTGTFEFKVWRPVNKPVMNANGAVEYIIHIVEDVTAEVKASKREASIQDIEKAYNLFMQAPVAVCIVKGTNYVVELANEEMLQFLGRTAAMVGKPIIESLTEAELQGLISILDRVRRTGTPYQIANFPAIILINGIREQRYFDLVFKPYFQRPEDTEPTGIFCVAHNITEQVIVQKQIQQSEQQVRSIVESAPFPIGVYVGREMRIEFANQAIIDVWGKGPDVIGKLYSEVLPELENQKIYAQLDSVYTTGVPFHAKYQRVDLVVYGSLQPFYFNYSFTPLFDADGKVYGVMNTAAEVTDLVVATKKVEQSERNFRNMILQSPVAMCIMLGAEHVVDIANEAMIELWGKGREAVINKPIFEALPDAREQGLEQVLADVYQTGIPFKASERPVKLERHGKLETTYQNFVYEPYRDTKGNTIGILAISVDVTTQVTARRVIEESREELQLAIEIAELGTFQVDLQANTGTFNHKIKEWFGFKDDKQNMEVIFSAIHVEDQKRVLEPIKQSQVVEENSRHDVTYKVVHPEDGMVRHLRSIGKTFFDLEGKAYEIRGVIQDVTPQVKYQHQIEESEALLKQRVTERTFELEQLNHELKRSNQNLEEFAYAASHDMKEPIRKIHFFADRLKQQLGDQLNEEQSRLFGRMEQAAQRMNLLIEDLLTYSHVSKNLSTVELVDLNQKIKQVMIDLELEIEQKKAKIMVGLLPTISGHKRQLQQLFQNLIGNALKYGQPGVPPEVKITSKLVYGHDMPLLLKGGEADKQYHLIEVRDNGIGFEQADAERIFNVFTRLHGNTEYRGTGVGLSIVRKVAENHGGYCWATAEPGKGAIFNVVLPAE